LSAFDLFFNKFFYKVAFKPVKDGLSSLTGFSFSIHKISCKVNSQTSPQQTA